MREDNLESGRWDRNAQAAGEIIPVLETTQEFLGDLTPGLGQALMASRVGGGFDPIRNEEVGTGARVTEGVIYSLPVIGAVLGRLGRWAQKVFFFADDAADLTADVRRAAAVADDVPAAQPRAVSVLAPDNYRGRFNADRHARGLSRLPDDYDAHHAIPQRYLDHPEFQDFDFHAPSNIRGVKGSRADVNIHQQITNRWEDFAQLHPNATRAEIEAFRDEIAAEFSQHWFQ
jgi:hypothetical protein